MSSEAESVRAEPLPGKTRLDQDGGRAECNSQARREHHSLTTAATYLRKVGVRLDLARMIRGEHPSAPTMA